MKGSNVKVGILNHFIVFMIIIIFRSEVSPKQSRKSTSHKSSTRFGNIFHEVLCSCHYIPAFFEIVILKTSAMHVHSSYTRKS